VEPFSDLLYGRLRSDRVPSGRADGSKERDPFELCEKGHFDSFSLAIDIKTVCVAMALFHRGQNLVKRQRRERCGVLGYAVGNDELLAMHRLPHE
jgi:hypothetical protein